jgi:hypothetical protein
MIKKIYYIGIINILFSHIIKSITNNNTNNNTNNIIHYLDMYGSLINIFYFYNKNKLLTYINFLWYFFSLIKLLKKNKWYSKEHI